MGAELRAVLEKCHAALSEGRPARTAELDGNQRKLLAGAQLLTSKPTLIVCNVSEETAGTECEMSRAVMDAVASRKDWDHVEVVRVCAKVRDDARDASTGGSSPPGTMQRFAD